MRKALVIGQVASLGRDIEVSQINLADIPGFHINTDEPSEGGSHAGQGDEADASASGGFLEGLDFSSRSARINELLGEWEEPEDKRAAVRCGIRRRELSSSGSKGFSFFYLPS